MYIWKKEIVSTCSCRRIRLMLMTGRRHWTAALGRTSCQTLRGAENQGHDEQSHKLCAPCSHLTRSYHALLFIRRTEEQVTGRYNSSTLLWLIPHRFTLVPILQVLYRRSGELR